MISSGFRTLLHQHLPALQLHNSIKYLFQDIHLHHQLSTKVADILPQARIHSRSRKRPFITEKKAYQPNNSIHLSTKMPLGNSPSPCSAEDFTQITVATAKCDVCNGRDRHTMKRCNTCSFQLCGSCSLKYGGHANSN